MLITTSLAAVFVSALARASAPAVATLPPMAISVSASPSISPSLVTQVLDEAAAVWRAAGLSFVWRRERNPLEAGAADREPCLPSVLRVVIGTGQASDAVRRSDATTALGWISFDEQGPASEVYLSFDNTMAYMAGAREVVGRIEGMPIAERELMLSRAMGRALAHEIGHYLLASKLHSARGLMRATHTANEFFSYDRSGFAIDAAERQAIAGRLQPAAWVARNDPR
jgi:hypothetical protein